MKKNKNKDNLLKRKKLRDFLKKEGFSRIKPEALEKIEIFIIEQLKILSKRLKQEEIIHGKNTLDKEVFESVFNE